MNFTKEQIDFVKHCGEHFEVLTGGRWHSKTKQIIEQLQQENQQLKDNWIKLKIWLEEYNIANEKWYSNGLSNHDREFYKKDYLDCKFFINKFIDKMQELEQGSDNK